MISHSIYPEQELFVVKVQGTLTVSSLLSAIKKLRSDKEFNPSFKGLWDVRGSKTDAGLDEVELAIEGLGAIPGTPPSQLALLADSPRTTAMATLFENLSRHLYLSKTFSTAEGAGEWLGKNIRPYVSKSHSETCCI